MRIEDETVDASVEDFVPAVQIEYHEPTRSYRVEFDQQIQSATGSVIIAVATAAGTDPLELPPLGAVLDANALDAFFDSSNYERENGETAVSFQYADYPVTVNGDGIVTVGPVEGSQT